MLADARTVLIVEDSDISREMLEAILEDDYRICACATATEAREILVTERDQVDVVLLDLMLPDIYGLDLLRLMQSDPDLAGIPVIVLTADEKAEVTCLEAGAVDFIPKPYPTSDVIHARIRRTLQLAENSMLGAVRGVANNRVLEVLSSEYLCVYYVDLETGRFVEYSATDEYRDMGIDTTGDDFFERSRANIPRVMLPEERAHFLDTFTKEHVLAELTARRSFELTYRLVFPGGTKHVHMRISYVSDEDDRHAIVGVNNIDDKVKTQEAFERVRKERKTFSRIAHTLAQEYASIHYVSVLDNSFIEYSSDTTYGALGIEKSGEDFFELSRKNTYAIMADEDRDAFQAAFTKENIMRSIDETGVFTTVYRLMLNGVPVWTSLKAVRMDDDPNRIVVATSNVDVQMRQQEQFRRSEEERVTYTRIAHALAGDYFSVYIINPESGHFVEYRAIEPEGALGVERSGDDFFGQVSHDVQERVHPDDRKMFSAEFERDKLMAELQHNGTFTLKYRYISNDVVSWVNLKATLTEDGNERRIIIGVNNIDAEVRREQEYNYHLSVAREKAYRDSLTGTKSKHAFLDKLEAMNQSIAAGTQGPFSVVMCDVNGLKEINDTRGHAAGDQHIRDAAAKICRTFKHSPVYRVGGDEFSAISEGQDYEHIDELVAGFRADSEQAVAEGGVVVACGLAKFAGEADFDAVFRKADSDMYENKKHLKP